jgi:very-long-chain (3R)-3-hydroxyacyl-CoA dehydratase
MASAQPSSPARSPTQSYLFLYNLLSCGLWSTILLRLLLLLPLLYFFHQTISTSSTPTTFHPASIHEALHLFVRNTQTLALLEPLHSLFGLVRAPLSTTMMQVASRILLVWAIVHRHPDIAADSWAFTTMVLAWSLAEVVRYGFFVLTLGGIGDRGGMAGELKKGVTWLRYV